MGSASDVLSAATRELTPPDGANQLVPLIAEGKAPRSVFATIAAEETRIVHSDWRSFLYLAARSENSDAREWFSGLGQGEAEALRRLPALAAATGADPQSYQPKPGCQAYPSYLAWLALNAHPVDAIVALVANFAAWGDYCATIARAMREHYGFDDAACGFFDLFTEPMPEADRQAEAAVQAALDDGWKDTQAMTYGRLFQSYELMFWNSIA